MEGFTAEDTEGTEGTGFYNRGSERSEGGCVGLGVADFAGGGVKVGCGMGFPQGRRGAERGAFYNNGSDGSEGGALVWASLTLLAWL